VAGALRAPVPEKQTEEVPSRVTPDSAPNPLQCERFFITRTGVYRRRIEAAVNPVQSTVLPSADPVSDLYREHGAWLCDWLRKKLGCVWEAADLTQDTFVRVLTSPAAGGQLAELREPRHFLVAIARRVMVDHLRRRALEKAWQEALALRPEPLAPSPENRALILETLCRIDAMLDGLGPRPRQAFLLSQLEGLRYAEIAARLGVSVSSVKKYVAQAAEHCLLLMLETPP
jgi:RNA polymerase sigma-70 factor (ECF subfamily)